MNNGRMPEGLSLDNDTLIILALAYILYRQDADIKIILALLSILVI